MTLRREQIGEALHDVRTLLLDPDSYGDTGLADAAESLASECVGDWRDEEIVRRLGEMADAEAGGDLKLARRHLRHAERKLAARGITPHESVPLIPDTVAKRLSQNGARAAAKVQVADCRNRTVSPQEAGTARDTHPPQEAA